MTRTSEGLQQKRTMEMIDMVMQMAPMIPRMPWVKWREVFKKLGDALNFPELQEVVDMQIAAQVAGQQDQGESAQPRLARDAGKVGAYGQRATGGAASEGRSQGQRASARAF
jgi:hypothetical protein